MANAPAFTAPDDAAFLKSLKLLAATTDTPQVFKKAFSAVLRGVETVLGERGHQEPDPDLLGGHPETHILGETFFSQVPVRWGDYVAKVAVAPVSPELTALTGAALNVNGKPDGLREAVRAFFAEHEGVWELRAQLRTGEDSMPVEDASVPWRRRRAPTSRWRGSPCRARIPGARTRCGRIDDGLAFNPWHGSRRAPSARRDHAGTPRRLPGLRRFPRRHNAARSTSRAGDNPVSAAGGQGGARRRPGHRPAPRYGRRETTRRRAVPGATVGGRIATTRKPRFSRAADRARAASPRRPAPARPGSPPRPYEPRGEAAGERQRRAARSGSLSTMASAASAAAAEAGADRWCRRGFAPGSSGGR